MAEPHITSRVPRRASTGKRLPLSVVILLLLVIGALGFIAGTAVSRPYSVGINDILGREQLDLSSVQETYQALKANYDGDIDTQKLIEGANKGLVNALGDQYTVYMNSKESTEFDNELTGNIGGGIGVEISLRNEVPTVERLLKDNPAEKAGLQVNDIVTKVNDESTKDKTLNQVVSKIRGDVDTTVKLTIVRSGVEKEFSVTRSKVNNPSAYGEVVSGNIGILTITRFDANTGSLARGVANEFKQKGVTGVILDLRGNGGGYVDAAQAVAGLWLDKQLVVTEKQGSATVASLNSTGTPVLNGVKTVILVNQSSASASEIVAGALRDHKVATIIGDTTFGKGSVQKILNLSNSAMLKVTIARWYTPSGINISEKGITPDTVVERTVEDFNANRDPQEEAAMMHFGVVVN